MKLPKVLYALIVVQSFCVFAKAFLGDIRWRESPFLWIFAFGILSPIMAASIFALDIQDTNKKIKFIALIAAIVITNITITTILGWIVGGGMP